MSNAPGFQLSDEALAVLLQRAARDQAPPQWVRERAVGLFAGPLPATPARGGELLRAAGAVGRRLIAEWVGGAGGFAPAFGVRGAAAGPMQRLYRAERCEIDLRIDLRRDAWHIAGQLFGIDEAQRVTLVGPAFEASAVPDTTQEFGFDAVPPGHYKLTVQAGELEIVVPALEVPARDGA